MDICIIIRILHGRLGEGEGGLQILCSHVENLQLLQSCPEPIKTWFLIGKLVQNLYC